MTSPIYAFDPDAPPDSDFAPGEPKHLAVGNHGRLLDARRTPVTITGLALERAAFEVRIDAFEDMGARWELPVWDVGRFQFARSCSTLGPDGVAAVERAREAFDREVVIDCDRATRRDTLDRIRAKRAQIADWLACRHPPEIDVDRHVASREGHPRLYALLEEFVTAQEVAELEREFAETYVSNPASGELLKGHAIVLAELGLCPFRGKIVRDAALFDPPRSKPQRTEHMISRLALTQALWSSWDYETVTLHRGAAVDGPLPARSPSSFVSATFSGEVAAAHYAGGPTTRTAVLWRQRVAISRLLMTFLETPQMNRRFHEAEAVLIPDPSNTAF